jgi:hypothetical protein
MYFLSNSIVRMQMRQDWQVLCTFGGFSATIYRQACGSGIIVIADWNCGTVSCLSHCFRMRPRPSMEHGNKANFLKIYYIITTPELKHYMKIKNIYFGCCCKT